MFDILVGRHTLYIHCLPNFQRRLNKEILRDMAEEHVAWKHGYSVHSFLSTIYTIFPKLHIATITVLLKQAKHTFSYSSLPCCFKCILVSFVPSPRSHLKPGNLFVFLVQVDGLLCHNKLLEKQHHFLLKQEVSLMATQLKFPNTLWWRSTSALQFWASPLSTSLLKWKQPAALPVLLWVLRTSWGCMCIKIG